MNHCRILLRYFLATCIFFGFLLAKSNAKIEKNKHWNQGKQAFEKGHYHEAITFFLMASSSIKQPATFADLAYHTAQSYRFIKNYPQAEEWYKKTYKSTDSIYYKPALFYLIQMLHNQNKLEDALEECKHFEKKYGSTPALEKQKASIAFAEKEQEKKTLYEVNVEKKLFSEGANVNPKWINSAPLNGSGSNRLLLFSSSRNGGVGFKKSPITGEPYLDLYYSSLDNKGKWFTPQPFGVNINSEANDADATLNARADTMYYTKCKQEKNQAAPCRIYRSLKKSGMWAEAEEQDILDLKKDQTTNLMHPNLSPDGRFLFFVSDLKTPQSYGGYDIWYCEWLDEKWSNCKNAGKNVNTAGDDLYPSLRETGKDKILYFSTEERLGMGGLDIFQALWKDLQFQEAKNLGSPINSTADDYGVTFKTLEQVSAVEINQDAMDESGFFSSNRDVDYRDQIYAFAYLENKFDLSIQVQDEETREPIDSVKVLLKGHGADESAHQFLTNKSGKVFLGEKSSTLRYILPNSTYSVTVSKPEAKMLSEHQIISTKGKERGDSFFVYFFTKTDRQKPFKFPEVRYDLDKYTLQVNKDVNSKDSLDYLYNLLLDNPSITIQLQAHTDARGSEEYNLKLSKQRAQECVQYLVKEKKIDAARLEAVGYGKQQNKYSEDYIAAQAKEEQEKYHQFNRRTEFIVTSWNYTSKDKK